MTYFDSRNAAFASSSGKADGLVAGTRVSSVSGWRPVESIIAGDRIMTFDSGMQVVTRVDRSLLWLEANECPKHLWPLEVPPHVLGNERRMRLLPEQLVMLESDIGEEVFGSPFTLIPAAALDGFHGIARVCPTDSVTVVTLCFKEDQVVFADQGALFYCPRFVCGEIQRDMLDLEYESPYIPLDFDQAESLATMIETEEARERVC